MVAPFNFFYFNSQSVRVLKTQRQQQNLRNEYKRDLRSNEHHLSNSENKAREKFRPVRSLNHNLCNIGAAIYQLS